MNIRQKNGAIRIALVDTNKPTNTDYVLVEPARCWSATFNAWGKKAAAPIIAIDGAHYKVTLERVT